MERIIGTEAMLHISFSLAAFVFSVVLYVLVCILGTGQVHKNLKFRTLTITIVIGNMISILDNIFRDSGMFPTPPQIKLALLLLVYLAVLGLCLGVLWLHRSAAPGLNEQHYELNSRVEYYLADSAASLSDPALSQ